MILTGLISGLTLATAGAEAWALRTDAQGLDAGEVKIPSTDRQMPAFFARPAGGGPFPTVLVIEEIFGVHEYIKDVGRRFTKLGYLAVALDLYAHHGDLSKMTAAAVIVRHVITKTPMTRCCATSTAPHPGPAPTTVTRPGPPSWASAAAAHCLA